MKRLEVRKPYSQLVMPAFCRLWLRFGRLSERAERTARQTKCFVGVLSWYDLEAGFGSVVIFSKFDRRSFPKGGQPDFSKSGQADFSVGGVQPAYRQR